MPWSGLHAAFGHLKVGCQVTGGVNVGSKGHCRIPREQVYLIYHFIGSGEGNLSVSHCVTTFSKVCILFVSLSVCFGLVCRNPVFSGFDDFVEFFHLLLGNGSLGEERGVKCDGQ